MAILSAKGLPANRESEAREAAAIVDAGFTALAMRDGVTKQELEAYQRNCDFLSSCIAERYRKHFGTNGESSQ